MAGLPTAQPGIMCCACMNIRAWGARCAMRVRDGALGAGAADCAAGAPGMTPGPGGAGVEEDGPGLAQPFSGRLFGKRGGG
jgi:hypothetical protein